MSASEKHAAVGYLLKAFPAVSETFILNEILGRPKNERPFLLLVTGYPAPGVQVPDIHRKPLAGIASFFDEADA